MNRLLLVLLLFVVSCSNPTFKPEQIAIVPKPEKMTLGKESFKIEASTTVFTSGDEQKKAVRSLVDLLGASAGYNLKVNSGSNNKGIVFQQVEGMDSEAYSLEVTPQRILISASAEAGYFYGVQTLRQLLPHAIESKQVVKIDWLVPCVKIEDAPRFEWRGMHMDFSRHFSRIEEVKDFLDYMALYKLNTYHMHLTDDQGWRIEIKKYPLLTQKGAWRVENSQDRVCNEKAKTNPLYTIEEKNYKEVDGKRMYGGFFTQEQIKEIIAYADQRCITVIPEIDMPGHFKAAIDNYPYLSCTGKAGWGATFSRPACLGKATTIEFVKDILSEVADLFPAQYIHIGGDEVNIKSWKKCPRCQREIRKNKLKNEHQLQSAFNIEIEKFLHSKGKRLMGWDEIAEGGLSKDATMMWWRNWAPKTRNIAADNGSDMIITPDFQYYFDFANEGTPLKKVYDYEPVPEDFSASQAKHVIGVQANLWSEYIPNFKRLQYQSFPRMLALAETGWVRKENKNFEGFLPRVLKHYDRMDQMGIYYYIPSVEGLSDHIAFVDSAVIELSSPLKQLEIYYTTDGSTPNKSSMKYTHPIVLKNDCVIKTRAFRGDIASEISESHVEKQSYLKSVTVSPVSGQLQQWAIKNKFKVVDDVKLPVSPKWKKVSAVGLGEYSDAPNVSMVFKGYFYASKKEMFHFATKSDDGSLLYIGEKLVVDNGGNHSGQLRTGMVALEKGWHPLTILFHQAGGGSELNAWYSEGSQPRKVIVGKIIGY